MSNEPKASIKSISMDSVLMWESTPYNLYIKLSDGRFLIVLRRGNIIDRDRLNKYALKGVTTLFASEQELSEAVGAGLGSADVVKLEALDKVGEAVFDELKTLGVSESSFNHAKAIGKAVRGMIMREPQLLAAFLKFQTLGREDVRHAMMVAAFSTVIVSSMEWIKPATHENVAMGALLHDFGMFTLPADIINADPATLTAANRKILEGHAEAGRALLAQVKAVPEDVQMIVAHHHERSDGSGYPLGLKDMYIHPLARVVGLANELVERYEIDRAASRETSLRQLVETLINSQGSKFNRDLVKSMRGMLASAAFLK